MRDFISTYDVLKPSNCHLLWHKIRKQATPAAVFNAFGVIKYRNYLPAEP